jgi:hypothetical protein
MENSMKNASITQPTAAENPNKTIRPLVSNASTGGGKRNMAVCFLSLRLKRTYLAIFAHQKLLDRKANYL